MRLYNVPRCGGFFFFFPLELGRKRWGNSATQRPEKSGEGRRARRRCGDVTRGQQQGIQKVECHSATWVRPAVSPHCAPRRGKGGAAEVARGQPRPRAVAFRTARAFESRVRSVVLGPVVISSFWRSGPGGCGGHVPGPAACATRGCGRGMGWGREARGGEGKGLSPGRGPWWPWWPRAIAACGRKGLAAKIGVRGWRRGAQGGDRRPRGQPTPREHLHPPFPTPGRQAQG